MVEGDDKKDPTAGQTPFKFKLITNVADFGLLQPLARSRGRLIASVLVANAVFIGSVFFVADYINNASSSVGLNMVLITATMLLMLVASYIDTMLLGDLFFPGNWRERVLLGKRMKVDSQQSLNVVNHKNYNLHFLVVLALVIVANYYSMRTLDGNWLDEYHEMGFHMTRMRSDDNSEKVRALKELAKNIYAERCNEKRVRAAILGELENPDLEVRRWAMFTIRQARLTDAYKRLVELLGEGDARTRGETALTLGSLLDKRATPHLTGFIKASGDSKEQLLGAMRGMMRLGDPEGGAALVPLLGHADTEIRAHAYWTIGKIKYTDAYNQILTTYEKDQDPITRCAALEALFRMPRKEDVEKFKEFFLLSGDEPSCDYIIWEEYNEEKTYVMYRESHRAKFLRFVANAVGKEERDWFALVASDKDRPHALRLLAGQIVQEIDK